LKIGQYLTKIWTITKWDSFFETHCIYRIYSKASVWLPVAMVTLLYRTLCCNQRWYDTVIRHTCVIPADRNFAFKIAAKPLQIETWLLLTAIMN